MTPLRGDIVGAVLAMRDAEFGDVNAKLGDMNGESGDATSSLKDIWLLAGRTSLSPLSLKGMGAENGIVLLQYGRRGE